MSKHSFRNVFSYFSRVKALIDASMKNRSPIAIKVGDERERRVLEVLDKMKDDHFIHDFLPTGKLSFADVMRGVDVYVTVVCESSYRLIKLSITGPKWVDEHKRKHSDTLVISVESYETDDAIRKRIEEEIKRFLCYH